jgi:dihydrodipicolinate reductase
MIKVIVNGCNGKMGKEIINSINCDPAFSLVGMTGSTDNL